MVNSPFDEQKYKCLLKGLEVSEVWLSKLDVNYIRIDSEYYSKQNLSNDCFFNNLICKNIGEIAAVADGDHSKFPDNQLQEVRYLQAKDIKNHFIENDNPVFVGKEYFETQKRSHIHEENIVLSIMGSVGDIAIIPKGFKTCIANRAIAIIKNIDGINPYYLFAFLSSKKGLQQIDKQKNGGVQQRINLDLLANIQIPILPISFQQEIEKTVKQAHAKREQSLTLYREAEALLLETIGLNSPPLEGCQPHHTRNEINEKGLNSPPLEGCQPQADGVVEMARSYDGVVKSAIINSTSPAYLENSTTPPLRGTPPEEGNSEGRFRNSKNYFALPYNPKLKERAKALRKAGMLHEVLVWNLLKNGGIEGLDFDRQKIIGNYIVDFYCAERNVVLEIDGSSHNDKEEYDAQRDEYLKSLGLEVIHIDAKAVLQQFSQVENYLREYFTTPPNVDFTTPPLRGTPPKEGNLEGNLEGNNEGNLEGNNEGNLPNYNIKSFSDSFLSTGRLDAEYYQQKYDLIENTFDKFERIALSSLVSYPISSGLTPKAGGDDYTDSKNGIPFIRAVDLVNGKTSTDNLNYIKQNVHNGILKRTQLKKGDVLFSIAGTVGRCAIFSYDFEANINQAVSILRFDEVKVSKLYLVSFFNSTIGKEFVSKYARQGLQTNLNLEEVGALKIPIVPQAIQQKIADSIAQSFALRRESEMLLEEAKDMVEREIEKMNN